MGGVAKAVGSIFGGGGGGGGSAPAPSNQTVTQTNIPEYARPYVERMLGKTEALTDINQNPYQPYGGQRIADFNQTQRDAFDEAIRQTPASQLGTATGLAERAGIGAINMQDRSNMLGDEALGYGQAGSMYGSLGADQAMAAARGAQRDAQMYGAEGAGFGRSAAGLAPEAQRYGQEASDIGMGGMNYGSMGAGYGTRGAQAAEQGFGAGEAFARQATDPNAIQAYMSPYMQNAVDFQKSQAIRDFDVGRQTQKARAVGAGAFGGSRQAIAEAEAQRNLSNQLAGIQATGTQKAFEDAQRQQQFGANLGLQGLQTGYGGLGLGIQGSDAGLRGLGTAMQGKEAGMRGLGQAGSLLGQGIAGSQLGLSSVGQQINAGQLGLSGADAGMKGAGYGLQGVTAATGAGQLGLGGLGAATSAAGTLGTLGQTEFGQEQNINAERQKIGAIKQGQDQSALDLDYQDFLSQRNYPYKQLSFFSDMLRGLPLSQSSTSMYSAPPSMASQLGGLGTTALGLYGMSGGFRANGGMVGKGYADGGLLAAQRYKNGGYADGGDISMLNVKQLTEMLDNPTLTPMEVEMIQKRIMLLNRMGSNPTTAEIMSGGIGSIPTGDMVPEEGMAGGGIVAFAKGGKSEDDYQKFLESQVRQSIERQMGDNAFSKSEAERAKLEQALAARQERSPYEALTMAGLGMMSGTSQYGLTNVGLGATEGLKSYSRSQAADAANRQKLLEQQVIADRAEDARKSGLTGQMQSTLGQMYNKQAALAAAEANKSRSGSDKEERNLLRAAALVGSDPTIKGLQKQLENSGYQPGSPEYNWYEQRIAERQNQIYKTVGVTVPEITPSTTPFPKPAEKPGFLDRLGKMLEGNRTPAASPKPNAAALPMPKSKDDLVKNSVYNTARGPATWDGKQFVATGN
jgi:hypothetical protein